MPQEIQKGYKQTEIGIIPEDWEAVKLGECINGNPSYGINAPSAPYNYRFFSYIRITDISDEGKFLKESRTSVQHPQAQTYLLEEGDIVFARTGASVGKSYLYNEEDGKLVYAGFLIRIKLNAKTLIPSFLKFLVQTKRYWTWVNENSMRSGQPGLNSQEYKSFPIPLPPTKEEQTAIAEALSDADDLINNLEQLIAKKRLIKQGAMQQLLTPKEGWEMKRLGDIAEIRKGEQLNRSELTDNGIYPAWNGGVEPSGKTNKMNASANSIIISEGGNSCGFTNYITENFWLGGHCYLLKINDFSIIESYLYSFLKFKQSQIMGLRVGSGLPNIQKKSLEKFIVDVPLLTEEQTQIATILSDMDAEIESLEKKLSKYKMLKLGMMQNLLTGKIRLI